MLLEDEPVTKLLPGSRRLILFVITVYGVPYFVACELHEVIGVIKGKPISKIAVPYILSS